MDFATIFGRLGSLWISCHGSIKKPCEFGGGSQSVSVLIACTVLRGDRVSVMISVLDGSFIGSTLFVGSQYIAALIPLKPLLQEALYSWW